VTGELLGEEASVAEFVDGVLGHADDVEVHDPRPARALMMSTTLARNGSTGLPAMSAPGRTRSGSAASSRKAHTKPVSSIWPTSAGSVTATSSWSVTAPS